MQYKLIILTCVYMHIVGFHYKIKSRKEVIVFVMTNGWYYDKSRPVANGKDVVAWCANNMKIMQEPIAFIKTL